MKKVRFQCQECGYEFVEEVVETQEAKEKNIPTTPVLCPKCGSVHLSRTY